MAYALPMKSQNETLRAYALGNFGDLSRAMVLDGSLIYWLDGQINVASAPNENLGREFLELFTPGIGNYTEGDVKAVARSFTGYRVVRSNGVVSFSPNRHDTSTLSLLGTSGTFDAPSLSDYAVSLEANAVLVARGMWFRFISTTTPAPPSLARDFAGRDIAALVRAVASHPGIRNPKNVQAKSPVEWFVSACRALAITPSHPSSLTVTNYLSAMGQIPFAPPNVGGWPADEAWLTAASTQYRLAFAAYLVQSGDLSPVTRALSTRALIVPTISWALAPGPKTAATPAAVMSSRSLWGTIPPTTTGMSEPLARRASTTSGANVRWAPDSIESPTTSTSSWIAALATVSGVWNSPV